MKGAEFAESNVVLKTDNVAWFSAQPLGEFVDGLINKELLQPGFTEIPLSASVAGKSMQLCDLLLD
jgi:hypothetical protein